MLRAVLFDVDGTLVDSNVLHAEAWVRAFQHFEIQVDTKSVLQQIGKGGDQLLPVFLSQDQIDRFGEELKKWRGELFMREFMPLVKPFPKVRNLLERVRQDGHKVALATSADQKELDKLKEIANISDLVEKESKSDDVEQSKPAPDIFLVALKKLKVDADEAIAVGDTPWDVEACNKIHLRCIGFTSGGWSEHDLRGAGCIEVYKGPADLLVHYATSSLDEGRAA